MEFPKHQNLIWTASRQMDSVVGHVTFDATGAAVGPQELVANHQKSTIKISDFWFSEAGFEFLGRKK